MIAETDIKRLRRYAAAMTGSTTTGDAVLEVWLTILVEQASTAAPVWTLPAAYASLTSLMADQRLRQMTVTVGKESPDPLAARVRELPLLARAAVVLIFLEGLSTPQTAAILGLPRKTVEELAQESVGALLGKAPGGVLIIEDDLLTARYLEQRVRSLGAFQVHKARHSDEAVRIGRREHPRLILADIKLGRGGNGMDAVRRLIQGCRGPLPNVILVTAHSELVEPGLEHLPAVSKPIDPVELNRLIAAALVA